MLQSKVRQSMCAEWNATVYGGSAMDEPVEELRMKEHRHKSPLSLQAMGGDSFSSTGDKKDEKGETGTYHAHHHVDRKRDSA